jgi:hypothetical protein
VRAAVVAVAVAVSCAKPPGSTEGKAGRPGAPAEVSPAASAGRGAPCTGPGAQDLECRQYASPVDAFLDAVGTGPLVIGVGEAHAPLGATVASSAKRFTGELLPALAGRASDLLVELMLPPAGCLDASAQVRELERPVTSRESGHNQDEYVAMGEKARALGVVPDLLRPSCADMDAVRDAGDDAVGASLELIARLARTQAERLVDRDARSDADRDKAVVLYGGMLHNDLDPRPGAADWSYAPALDAHVRGRFVAVDLVVPEFIGDDETWASLPWRSHYDRSKLGAKTTLFRTGDRSFVLVFAMSR